MLRISPNAFRLKSPRRRQLLDAAVAYTARGVNAITIKLVKRAVGKRQKEQDLWMIGAFSDGQTPAYQPCP